ncbi:MAG TPA: amidohydrolase family protein [Gemmatimonadaceae bacterium]|nr:amidohydrolase family protein [Gemmatimonadaceae bacterium]
MLLDLHVHVSAFLPGHGHVSARAERSLPFRYMRRQMRIPKGNGEAAEVAVAERLFAAIDGAAEVDAAVVLAFDAVYDGDGRRDDEGTHLFVENDYVRDLAARHSKVRYGASVHPYRRDAVAEVERCARDGAVLLKWLPITQRFDPSDRRCFPVYEALAALGVPLLSHTGWEHTLPRLLPRAADPSLLVPALERGVTVIAAHCGSGAVPGGRDYLDDFIRLTHVHERLYGDTAGMSLPNRWYAFERLLADDVARSRLVHGSDWPIPAYPDPRRVGLRATRTLLAEKNQLRRDVLVKRAMGLDDEAYWRRGGDLLGGKR